MVLDASGMEDMDSMDCDVDDLVDEGESVGPDLLADNASEVMHRGAADGLRPEDMQVFVGS